MNSLPFLKSKRLVAVALWGVFLASLLRVAQAKEKKDPFPDYSRLEYAKPLPPVDQQEVQPKPGSISRKFGERPENPYAGTDPLTNIPVPLLHGAGRGTDFEPPITDILESTELQPASPIAKSTAAVAAPTPGVPASTETPKN